MISSILFSRFALAVKAGKWDVLFLVVVNAFPHKPKIGRFTFAKENILRYKQPAFFFLDVCRNRLQFLREYL